MKKLSLGLALLGLFLGVWLPSARANKYIFDKETDGLLLDLSIIFLVLCTIFLMVVIILTVSLYKKRNGNWSRAGYTISYHYNETSLKDDSIPSPFYGHSIYSYRHDSHIYLPGRSTFISTKSDESHDYENNGMVLTEGADKRNSPPPEEGPDAERSERTRKSKNATYDNPAFEIPGYESLGNYDNDEDLDRHDYEMLDPSAAIKVTSTVL